MTKNLSFISGLHQVCTCHPVSEDCSVANPLQNDPFWTYRLYSCLHLDKCTITHLILASQAVADSGLTEEEILDWLCFNLDASELPGNFAGNVSSRAAGNKIEVLGRQHAGERPMYQHLPS